MTNVDGLGHAILWLLGTDMGNLTALVLISLLIFYWWRTA